MRHLISEYVGATHAQNEPNDSPAHFFFPPAAASFLSHAVTFPSITTPFPSMKAIRDKPSQFLKESHTSGCCGWKAHSAISFDLSECGSSIFFSTRLLTHLPDKFRQTASRAATTYESDRRVAAFDFIRDIQNLNLGVKFFRLTQGGVLFVHHHVAAPGHVVLIETLDVEPDVVPRVCKVDSRVVHFDCENFPRAWIRSRVRGQKDDFFPRFHNTLLDTASEHVADALNLVNA